MTKRAVAELVLSINTVTGQVAYGGVLIEPGSGPLSSTTGITDMVGTVHWLDVPPAVHDWGVYGTGAPESPPVPQVHPSC